MPLPTKISEPIIDPAQLSILIYGATKTGKSTFASRAEGVLFLPIDPGLKAIKGYKYDPLGLNRPDAMITKWSEIIQAHDELKAGGHPFRAFAFDTLDNAYRLCLEHMCKELNIRHESDLGYGKGYALINNEFLRVMMLFSALPMGQIYCCHEQVLNLKLRTGEIEKMVPDLPKGPRGRIMRMVDFVLYAHVVDSEEVDDEGKKKKAFLLGTSPDPTFDAGNRFSSVLHLPQRIYTSYPGFIKRFKAGMGVAGAALEGAGKMETEKMFPDVSDAEPVKTEVKAGPPKADAPKADIVKDTAGKPDATKPDAAKPDTSKPVTDKPTDQKAAATSKK